MLFFKKRGNWWDQYNIGGIVPTMVLDFAGVEASRYMADGVDVSEASLLSFTRSSTALFRDASGIYQEAASGVRRLDHDVDGSRFGLPIEIARTNICLWSDDWTNAAYDTVTNMTVAKDQTGADGVSNSASSLLAAAGNAIITQSITSGSATRVYSVHIKRITGTGNIELTQDGGSTWLNISGSINSSTYVQVFTVSASVTNPVVGVRIVTNTDEIAVQYGDSETGAWVTLPIPTTTVSASRTQEIMALDSSAWVYSDTVGSFVQHFRRRNDEWGARILAGGSARAPFQTAGNIIDTWSGENALNGPNVDGSMDDMNLHKSVISYDGTGRAINSDGNTEGSDANDFMQFTNATFYVGSRSSGAQASAWTSVLIWYPSRLSTAQNVTVTT